MGTASTVRARCSCSSDCRGLGLRCSRRQAIRAVGCSNALRRLCGAGHITLMKRSLLILIVVLLAGTALFGASYVMGRRVCQACVTRSADNLDWLRQEFNLSDAEMARVRELHQSYLPKCAEMCGKIASKKEELDQAL